MNNKTETTKKIAIILSGEMGAGKTTAANYIRDSFGYDHLSYVDLIWLPILEKRNIPVTRESLQNMGDELRNKYGNRGLARKIFPFILDSKKIIIDDVRHPDVYFELKKCLDFKTYLLYIKANEVVRIPRLVKRDNILSKEEFDESEQRMTEIAINEVEKYADFVINNEVDLKCFYKKIDECIKKIDKV